MLKQQLLKSLLFIKCWIMAKLQQDRGKSTSCLRSLWYQIRHVANRPLRIAFQEGILTSSSFTARNVKTSRSLQCKIKFQTQISEIYISLVPYRLCYDFNFGIKLRFRLKSGLEPRIIIATIMCCCVSSKLYIIIAVLDWSTFFYLTYFKQDHFGK